MSNKVVVPLEPALSAQAQFDLAFCTQYQRIAQHQRFATNPGNGLIPTYSPRYATDGVLVLKEDGQHNLYEEIQSHRDSTDIELIIDRYFNGDPTALSRVQGTYADITNMPQNMHEAMALVDNARRDFESLPVDIKQLFDNDPNQFLATLGTEEWFNKMQISQNNEAKSVESSENISVSDKVSE